MKIDTWCQIMTQSNYDSSIANSQCRDDVRQSRRTPHFHGSKFQQKKRGDFLVSHASLSALRSVATILHETILFAGELLAGSARLVSPMHVRIRTRFAGSPVFVVEVASESGQPLPMVTVMSVGGRSDLSLVIKSKGTGKSSPISCRCTKIVAILKPSSESHMK
jgi:hypothetical protein